MKTADSGLLGDRVPLPSNDYLTRFSVLLRAGA